MVPQNNAGGGSALSRRNVLLGRSAVLGLQLRGLGAQAQRACTPTEKPNILVIFGDDIGWMNVRRNGGDIMGVQTPNIDRIGAKVCG